MNELTKGLTNLRSLRAAVRDLTLEQAESSLLKLQTAIEEKRAQAAEIEQAEQERRELIKQEGITAEELTAIIGAAPSSIRKKRESRPAKYKYTDETGQERTWTGQGRTPRVIQKALDKGVSLASFEI